MTIDKNPSFGRDTRQKNFAENSALMLWELCKGDMSKVPESYLEALGFEYSDGTVSLLNLLNKVEFSEQPSKAEFLGVVSEMVKVDPEDWPSERTILSIQPDKFRRESENFSESFLNYAREMSMSDKITLFLRRVIASVYLDGVGSVTDSNGNPPGPENNYLRTEDGKGFEGIFYDADEGDEKSFPFQISEKSDGAYEISY